MFSRNPVITCLLKDSYWSWSTCYNTKSISVILFFMILFLCNIPFLSLFFKYLLIIQMCYYFFDLYLLFRFVYYPANYIHWRCYCGDDDVYTLKILATHSSSVSRMLQINSCLMEQ